MMPFVSSSVSRECTAQLPGLKRSNSRGSLTRQTLAEAAKLGLKPHATQHSISLQHNASWGRQSSSVSERSTPSACSDRSRCGSACSDASSEAVSPAPAPAECLIIFDWDDTLLPTSWLRQLETRGPTARTRFVDLQLRKHAILVEETLRAAHMLGRVAIVTLAKSGWVVNTGMEFLPGVDIESLIAELEIQVYYSREEDCPGAWDREDYSLLKRMSMGHCLRTWCSSRPALHVGTVLSIGDSIIEQEALKAVFADPQNLCTKNLHCKTLKLMDSPRRCELGEQLRQLTQLLPRLVATQKSFSVSVVKPQQLENLCGL
jgi:hypothetical protein